MKPASSALPGRELERKFLDIPDVSGEVDPEELVSAAIAFGKAKTWPETLEGRYVVVLGEAGTGKTTEFRRQASLAGGDGEGFFVELTALSNDGLRDSLLPDEAARLSDWKDSNREATFFLDSLDEAKLQRRTLRDALRKLQRELGQQWVRVRLVISCRVSDWRETDRAAVQEVVACRPEGRDSGRSDRAPCFGTGRDARCARRCPRRRWLHPSRGRRLRSGVRRAPPRR